MPRLSGLFATFFKTADQPSADTVHRIKTWVDACFDGAPPSTSINELICDDPACPGIETVILIMAEGEKTRAAKIAKPMEAVTEEDVQNALLTLS